MRRTDWLPSPLEGEGWGRGVSFTSRRQRDSFSLFRAFGANQSINKFVIAVPEPRSAYFLLLVQEKVRKEKDTPVAAPPRLLFLSRGRCPALLADPEREPNSPARIKTNSARSGSDIVSRSPSGSAAVLGLLYGEGTAATTLFRSARCSSRYRSQRKYRFELVVLYREVRISRERRDCAERFGNRK